MLLAAGLVAGATLVGPVPVRAGPPPGPVPFQYMAKAATELLGRDPTPAEWRRGQAFFGAQGCSTASLTAYGLQVVAGKEYAQDYRGDPAGQVLTLYRFILNRDPDPAGFVRWRDALGSGTSPTAVATALFAGPEFQDAVAPAVCDPAIASDGFGPIGNPFGAPALSLPESGAPGPDLSEGPLQLALDYRAFHGGGPYRLPARTVVGLTTTLFVPPGVTLETAGRPDPKRYADMARLARLPGFANAPKNPDQELVHVDPGGRLEHVWVDGQRFIPDPSEFPVYSVRMGSGTDTAVADDRVGDPEGASGIEADGETGEAPGHLPCRDNRIVDNLVEGYATYHGYPPGGPPNDHPESDGIGVYCEDALVEGNQEVDISDSGIVLFDGAPLATGVPPQISQVRDNTMVSAGISSYFGIVTDPGYDLAGGDQPGGDPAGVLTRSFGRPGRPWATIAHNHLWTGTRTHIDVVLSDGTHDLFGSVFHQVCVLPSPQNSAVGVCGGGRNATGARWLDNTSDGLGVTAELGIYVSGSVGAVFAGNRLGPFRPVFGPGACPRAAAALATGTAPSNDMARRVRIDQPWVPDRTLQGDACVTPSF